MRSIQRCLLAALAGLLPAQAGALGAQVVEKKGLTLDGARRVIAAAVGEAKKRNATGVIAVVDEGGNTVALERLDNTFAAGANISIGKARTAVLFKRPTKAFEDIIRNGRTPMVALNDFTPLQGGIPIVVDGQVVGGVGVSGASSAQEDEELALAGANGLMAPAAVNTGASVEFFTSKDVAAAFAKGSVLLDGTGRNYMVHASRREKPGQVEVHELDTDVIYVLNGSATFVTGGSVVDGKVTEPREIRGVSIDGGDTRTIGKGDVITVPNGTPHWFKEVKGPLTYYVVKVRADAGGTTWAAR
jgi:glc operon protein GlcG